MLYIAGTGRSGSTLLAGTLGQVPGFFNAGEVRYIWERGLVENRLCGCGRHFQDCPVWQEILTRAFGSRLPDPRVMQRAQSRLTRLRHLPALMLGRDGGGGASVQAYRSALGSLYRATATATGSQVIVDPSKLPSYGRVLSALPGIDLYVVQLVRDPRAAAGSWAGVKEQPDRGVPGTMQRLSPMHSAMLWNLWNTSARGLLKPKSARYMTLKYEDFVAAPRRTVERIVEMVGMAGAELPFLDASTVALGPNHTVSGNPDRLRSGPVTIKTDAGKSKQLRGRDKAIVTALTVPVLLRFGYPLSLSAKGRQPERIGIQHLPGPLRTLRRLQRHWRWGRAEGFGRLVEEDQLDPRARLAVASRRREWRRHNPVAPGSTTPVFLVGLQRSGTNMVARALEANPEFEVRNENDGAAFDRFRLRPLPVVRDLVMQSQQRFTVLKPLIDSHRVDELLAELGTPSPGKAVWTYRSVDGRVRSAVSKFGDQNLQVVKAIAQGRDADLWQAQRISDKSREFVRALDLDSLTQEGASAVIWYLRNTLYFETGLDARDDCMLISYDRLLDDPQREVGRICDFLGTDFRPEMITGIGRRGGPKQDELPLEPMVRARCNELERRLEEALASAVAI
ncbi:MAG: sulfotransferase [Candidatus Dormibacteraeota bacterium]|nr:sulfotransferase [Candidatus Dormibacteraeota bacterium]